MLHCVGFIFFMSCSPVGGVPASAEYCQIAKPVRPHPNDTRGTKVQADREYRKWKALCKKSP